MEKSDLAMLFKSQHYFHIKFFCEFIQVFYFIFSCEVMFYLSCKQQKGYYQMFFMHYSYADKKKSSIIYINMLVSIAICKDYF